MTADRLTVFVTADPELPVPPRHYGGIERIVDLLVDGLSRRGHRVVLFAHRDSTANAELIPYAGTRSRARADTLRHAAQIARAVATRRPDVVQSFGRLAYLAPILPLPVAKVMSYQRAVTARGVRRSLALARGTLRLTSCSFSLIRALGDSGPWRVIHNAVPVEQWPWTASVPSDAPLVFLGRIEHIKGTHLAIEIARRAGRQLVIAGNIAPEHRDYFDRAIGPFVDGRAVRYAGPVDDAAKQELLGRAAALLMPILWDEPFGIVMAEALAAGTPVIGLDRGAVAEVVDHGVTGFVGREIDDLVAAVGRLGGIDRTACRCAAERRFSADVLVGAYESLYEEMLRPATARTSQRSTAMRGVPR